jgi:hypothetical protein
VIAPCEEAADSKIAVKHGELQHALQSQAKLNAVHASQRTQQRHETIGTQPAYCLDPTYSTLQHALSVISCPARPSIGSPCCVGLCCAVLGCSCD